MFKKYPSLENHYREKFINSIKMNLNSVVAENPIDFTAARVLQGITASDKWVATEKVHGANFQLFCDGEEVRPGSRSQFVDENFYACGPVVERYKSNVLSIFDYINRNSTGIKSIAVFGELFGGLFEGRKETHAKTVQKGVHYIPHNDMIVFDIRVDYEVDSDGTVEHWFLPFSIVNDLIAREGMKTTPVIGVGEFRSVMALPNDKDSLIPGIYGLTATQPNVMEGIVIRPLYGDLYLPNGSRAIVKSKNEKWSEKQKTKIKNKPKNFEHPVQKDILEYINTNRLEAVLSKIGGIESCEPSDFGKVLGMMSSDVVEDLIKDEVLPENWKKSDELKPLGGWITKQVKELLIEEFMPKV